MAKINRGVTRLTLLTLFVLSISAWLFAEDPASVFFLAESAVTIVFGVCVEAIANFPEPEEDNKEDDKTE